MHYLFLIHGIGDGTPSDDFEQFAERLRDAYCDYHKCSKATFKNKFKIVPVNWDHATEGPELNLYSKAFRVPRRSDRSLTSGNPLESVLGLFNTHAWRYFMTFFVGDAIAYVDENNNGIRESVWKTISTSLGVGVNAEIPKYSIISHSLGSVIAFDYAFSLLEPKKKNQKPYFSFTSNNLTQGDLEKLQKGFQHLITFGSPIALFWMRNKDLWDNNFAALKNPIKGEGRLWLNYWDNDDLVAYPLEKFFEGKEGHIDDIRVETGLTMPWAHTGYWKDSELINDLAASL